jgi:hypothetical protein
VLFGCRKATRYLRSSSWSSVGGTLPKPAVRRKSVSLVRSRRNHATKLALGQKGTRGTPNNRRYTTREVKSLLGAKKRASPTPVVDQPYLLCLAFRPGKMNACAA